MLEALQQLLKFMRTHKKLWMAPVILGLLVLGGVLIMVEGSAVAPLIYAIF